MLTAMAITEKVLESFQRPACGISMSADNLKYSHAGYCIKRVQEVDHTKAISVPKKIKPKFNKSVPVK
jgi:hypothetical protein